MNKKSYLLGVASLVAAIAAVGLLRPQLATMQAEEPQSASLGQVLTTVTPPPLPGYANAEEHTIYSGERTITYDVMTRGVISADVDEFKRQAQETLQDTRGWSRLGLTFSEVPRGGDFTLVLAAADQMTSFSADGCHELWSCNVGRYVIVNQDRWLGATDPWNAAGGNLRDYRHMVVNHEVGHNLGRGHSDCNTAGSFAAVMQQQSYDLQGCEFNPWPLPSEVVRRQE